MGKFYAVNTVCHSVNVKMIPVFSSMGIYPIGTKAVREPKMSSGNILNSRDIISSVSTIIITSNSLVESLKCNLLMINDPMRTKADKLCH